MNVLTIMINAEEGNTLVRQTSRGGCAHHYVLDVLLHQVALVCYNNWASKSVQVRVVKLI